MDREARLFHALQEHPDRHKLLSKSRVESVGLAKKGGDYIILVRITKHTPRDVPKTMTLETTEGSETLPVVLRRIKGDCLKLGFEE